FRSYIPPPRGGLRVEDFRVVANDGHQATLELLPAPGTPEGTIPSRYVFDLATGIMVHSTSYDGDQLGHEVWQLAVTEYPGGIVMPALRVATLYRGGRLNTLRVLIIEEAEFNGPVSEDEFVMPVAEGTVLVDYRHPQTAVWKTETAADDVRSLLVPVSRPAPGVSGGIGLSWHMLLILNGVALIVIAIILWRRGSQSQVPPVKPPTSEPS